MVLLNRPSSAKVGQLFGAGRVWLGRFRAYLYADLVHQYFINWDPNTCIFFLYGIIAQITVDSIELRRR